MANQKYSRTTNIDEYKHKYPNASVMLDLDQKSLGLSGSKWGTRHLIACRLIQKAGGKLLPVLEEFAPKPEDLKSHKEWRNIKPLINCPRNLHLKSRLQLERESGSLGTLWSALAKLLVPKEDVDDNTRPQRVERRNYTESSPELSKSSSSPTESSPELSESSSSPTESQQSFDPNSSNYSEFGEDENADRTKPEILTVNLAGAFIRYVLNFCAEQDPEKGILAEFREEPIRMTYNLNNHLKIDATDDGGIWSVGTKEKDNRPWIWRRRLALLEAKKAFQRIDINNRPEISDRQLSQYTCEALTACIDNEDNEESGDEVFVIVMTQTFMCFLNFHPTKEYMEYLRYDNSEQQRASGAFLHVTDTEFFALNTKEGRRHAVCNLLGLVKFWESKDKRMKEIEGSKEEGESKVDIDDSNDEDPNPRDRKRKSRVS